MAILESALQAFLLAFVCVSDFEVTRIQMSNCFIACAVLSGGSCPFIFSSGISIKVGFRESSFEAFTRESAISFLFLSVIMSTDSPSFACIQVFRIIRVACFNSPILRTNTFITRRSCWACYFFIIYTSRTFTEITIIFY